MKKLFFLIPIFALFSCEPEKETKPFLDADGIPMPTHYFTNDFTGKMLDSTEIGKLNRRLKAYEDSTTNQIVVICLPKLPDNKNGNTWNLEELTTETFRKWGIGQKDKNNGVLFLIAFDDHKNRIEPGYGLEGALPDIICKHILDENVKPHFEDEKYYEGIDEAITKMEKAIAGEYLAERKAEKDEYNFWIWLAVGLGIAGLLGFIRLIIAAIVGGAYGGFYWYYMHPPLHDIPEAIAAVFICAVLGIIAKFVIEAGIGFDGSSSDSSGGSGGFFGGGGGSGGGGASGSW
jgi:uncharacterized protein